MELFLKKVHVAVDVEPLGNDLGADVVEHDERADNAELRCGQRPLATDTWDHSVDARVTGDAPNCPGSHRCLDLPTGGELAHAAKALVD